MRTVVRHVPRAAVHGDLPRARQAIRDRGTVLGRDLVPKTLIFAKNDNHAEEIVEIVRDVFGKGNDFCTKITHAAPKPASACRRIP